MKITRINQLLPDTQEGSNDIHYIFVLPFHRCHMISDVADSEGTTNI